MGIVFGDIGTSPLYAFKEAAKAASLGGVLTGRGTGYCVINLLVADYRYFHQIRDPNHEGRQSRRGRHPGFARADQSASR